MLTTIKNQQQYLKELATFCRNFINGDYKHSNVIIDNYRHLFMQTDIQELNLTQKTFDSSFKSMCKKLFDTRPADNKSYIIPLLGFALQLHEYHLIHHCIWYHVEILIDSLVDVLENINFQLKELTTVEPTYYYCIIL